MANISATQAHSRLSIFPPCQDCVPQSDVTTCSSDIRDVQYEGGQRFFCSVDQTRLQNVPSLDMNEQKSLQMILITYKTRTKMRARTLVKLKYKEVRVGIKWVGCRRERVMEGRQLSGQGREVARRAVMKTSFTDKRLFRTVRSTFANSLDYTVTVLVLCMLLLNVLSILKACILQNTIKFCLNLQRFFDIIHSSQLKFYISIITVKNII